MTNPSLCYCQGDCITTPRAELLSLSSASFPVWQFPIILRLEELPPPPSGRWLFVLFVQLFVQTGTWHQSDDPWSFVTQVTVWVQRPRETGIPWNSTNEPSVILIYWILYKYDLIGKHQKELTWNIVELHGWFTVYTCVLIILCSYKLIIVDDIIDSWIWWWFHAVLDVSVISTVSKLWRAVSHAWSPCLP